jgi:hypothetical protein
LPQFIIQIGRKSKVMKTRNTFIKGLLLAALVAGFPFIIATWRAPQVQALQDSEDRPSPFGFIELGSGQTARLNAVIGNPEETPGDERFARRVRLAFDVYVEDEENTPNCGGIVPVPTCLRRYRFLRRESTEVELMPGQAASFEFLASAPTKIDASVNFLGGPDTLPGTRRTPEPHLAPTLEVRESARTIFVVPAVARGFNPQPDPPGQQQ